MKKMFLSLLLIVTSISGNGYANEASTLQITPENIGAIHNEAMVWVHRKMVVLNEKVSISYLKEKGLLNCILREYLADFFAQKGVIDKTNALCTLALVENAELQFLSQLEEKFSIQVGLVIDEMLSVGEMTRKINILVSKYGSKIRRKIRRLPRTDTKNRNKLEAQLKRIKSYANIAVKSYELWTSTDLSLFVTSTGTAEMASKVTKSDYDGAVGGMLAGAFAGPEGSLVGGLLGAAAASIVEALD